jgi:hypothetical protein
MLPEPQSAYASAREFYSTGEISRFLNPSTLDVFGNLTDGQTQKIDLENTEPT